MKGLLVACALGAWLGIAGCSNYADMLGRGQAYYERNEYERALSVWRNLEADRDSLGPDGRVRYYYLRGMTAFRLGYAPDARYWLGLAQASRPTARDALSQDESKRLEETLSGLSKQVFGLANEAEASMEAELGEKCAWTSECESGFICEDGFCVQTDASTSSEQPQTTPPPAGAGTTTP
jgi:hypothetical protein